MKIVVDCEFTQLNQNSKLISMALVSEEGHELYFELNDNYRHEDCSEFVVERVIPQLSGGSALISTESARNKLWSFLSQFDSVEIMSDAPIWDWEFFCSIVYHQGKWPSNVANTPINLIDLFNEKGVDGEEAPELPHHALLDARLLMSYYKQYLKE
ncbi:hypothetical protein C1882_18330 [Pseudomonas sp. FW305-E2]|uniref:3'-5' exoribonuclease n=1 Tax=Pseudomonas sp. FW305-E2 TaxID=2075558 RepID=UPI000B4EA065|nr:MULTISPECIES: 3'-5' exoribonuclease [Pseudomonas]POA83704.1 hypothetical protein C1882_18330 [Pseudomonas sp. FW305-E2]